MLSHHLIHRSRSTVENYSIRAWFWQVIFNHLFINKSNTTFPIIMLLINSKENIDVLVASINLLELSSQKYITWSLVGED